MITKLNLTSSWQQDGVATKVCDLDHHAVVNHTVGRLEATVDLNVTGVEIRHALLNTEQEGSGEQNR